MARASARLGFGARALASRSSRCAWRMLDPPGALATTEAPRWARRHGGAPKANNATPAPSGLGIAAVMRELAATDPGAVAVVTSSGEEITYRAIFTTAESIAGSLRATVAAANAADASPSAAAPSPRDPARDDALPRRRRRERLRGERVAISATPGPEFIAAVHAAWMCGAIAVPIARGHTRDEVEHVLNDSGAVAFAVVPDRPTSLTTTPPPPIDGPPPRTDTCESTTTLSNPPAFVRPSWSRASPPRTRTRLPAALARRVARALRFAPPRRRRDPHLHQRHHRPT